MGVTIYDYDVAIIGAGIGGLMCGNFLAKNGIKTLICERRELPGGYMSGFYRNGFYFDAADQSFESMWAVFPLMKRLGLLEKIAFKKADYRFVLPEADIILDSYIGVTKQFQVV